ncbi:bacterioferritin-associated ferredoxin [Labilibacter marinus]|uniref:hypothetical protein n=1 Tax=Labilibacter marinus TaxID=1477105 RepID=UPI00094FA10C|nr:hypothetical protein [Labilibacter marinus]
MSDIVCYCGNVDRETLAKVIKDGAKSIEDIRWITAACKDNRCATTNPKGVCCEDEIKAMIVAEHGCIEDYCTCCGG